MHCVLHRTQVASRRAMRPPERMRHVLRQDEAVPLLPRASPGVGATANGVVATTMSTLPTGGVAMANIVRPDGSVCRRADGCTKGHGHSGICDAAPFVFNYAELGRRGKKRDDTLDHRAPKTDATAQLARRTRLHARRVPSHPACVHAQRSLRDCVPVGWLWFCAGVCLRVECRALRPCPALADDRRDLGLYVTVCVPEVPEVVCM